MMMATGFFAVDVFGREAMEANPAGKKSESGARIRSERRGKVQAAMDPEQAKTADPELKSAA
jgi:hypothetical protein